MNTMFRPEVWSKPILDMMRLTPTWQRRTEYDRLGHSEVTQLSADEIQARTEATTAWQTLTDELIAKGWLTDDLDGYYPNEDTERRQWVYDETEDEHQARVNALPPHPDTVTIPVKPRPILNDENTAHIKAALQTES